MERLLYTSTRLRVMGKQGILKPDSEGYYTMPIGAFNCVNSANELYTLENIDGIFNQSSELMRKVQNGKLFGEWGHPDMLPGESGNEFMGRACRINDKETCVFFKEIWLDRNITPEMQAYGVPKDAVITMARLKPMGSKWEALERSLQDPNVNTTFSGRFLTRDRVHRGVTHVIVESVVTWDAVTEQGIPAAEKWLSPRLESHKTTITPKAVEAMKQRMATPGFRMENNEALVSVVKTAEKFFAEQQSSRGYKNW